MEAERTAMALAQRHQLPDVVARVLAGRGVRLQNAAEELDPTIRALLPDPSRLTDCDGLVERLADAIASNAAIVLFADYDVDGATSAAVVARTLEMLGASARIVIPDRLTDGYGPSVAAMERLADEGAQIIITLDCGAGACEPIAAAKARGLTVLVIDHHPVENLAPADFVVNPNRADDLSGLQSCAAVGVAFVVMVALVREMRRRGAFSERAEPNLMPLLDCVALGTIADVVPLTVLNRAFVRRGLTAIANRTNLGLAALNDAARIGGPVEAHHLGYVLGPRINAGGRIGDSGLGARLLTTADRVEAETIAATLDGLNRERRTLETKALAEADAMVDPAKAIIVVAGAWHPGVVGLVASRLKERYRKPAVAIALVDGIGTGSARSVPGVDLGAAIRSAAAEGVVTKGGGHAMAAGLTVSADGIGGLSGYLEERLADAVHAARAAERLAIDAVVSPASLDEALAKTLRDHGPWGAGRPKPVFALDAVLVEAAVPVGADSLRLTLRGLGGAPVEAMLFRASGPLGDRLRGARGQLVHLAIELGHGTFRGVARAEVVVVDAADVAATLRQAA